MSAAAAACVSRPEGQNYVEMSADNVSTVQAGDSPPASSSGSDAEVSAVADMRATSEDQSVRRLVLCFPGGGIFFYWQAGALDAIATAHDLSSSFLPSSSSSSSSSPLSFSFSGASAGSLTAVLAACGVKGRHAAEEAFRVSTERGLWDRQAGLAGVWGAMVREWLDRLLPSDAAERCNDRLGIAVMMLPSIRNRQPLLRSQLISSFHSRADLIDCLLASVHIPFFMDGRPWTVFRNRRCIDGSFLLDRETLLLPGHQPLFLDYMEDEAVAHRGWEFLSLSDEGGVTPEGTWQRVEALMDHGKAYAMSQVLQGKHGQLLRDFT